MLSNIAFWGDFFYLFVYRQLKDQVFFSGGASC